MSRETSLKLTADNAFKWAAVIATLIISFSVFYYFVIFLPNKDKSRSLNEQQKLLEKTQTELNKAQDTKRDLEDCLYKAEKEYNDIFVINSYPDPRPSYPDARTWDSFTIQNESTQKLQDDKSLCIKLYPPN